MKQTPPLKHTPLDPSSLDPIRSLIPEGRDGLAALLETPGRGQAMRISLDDMVMDYSRQPVSGEAMDALVALAETRQVSGWRDAMLAGEVINHSEGRPVLHAALRDPEQAMAREGVDAMAAQVDYLLSLGVEDIVSIGIGGSDLGPAMAVEALAPFHQGPELHFISNIDPAHLSDCLATLNPLTTAFIVISKTFTTMETLANMVMAKRWITDAGMAVSERMIAVTAAADQARQHGIDNQRILTMNDGIGGRFSLWSAVGLGIMIAVGREGFIDLLAGAESMDRHFAMTPPEANMAMAGGLLRFLHSTVLGRSTQAIIPYDQRLARLPAWMQQLEMESNGKPAALPGEGASLGTAPVIFGEVGSSAQHSFFQLLHQGPSITPVDFLAPMNPVSFFGGDDPLVQHQHRALLVNMLAQADALALGAVSNGFPGGRPSTIFTWDETGPFALGRLLALYEHITAVHGWMLGLNSFDQPGVELGKKLAGRYQQWIDGDDAIDLTESSAHFLQRFRDRD